MARHRFGTFGAAFGIRVSPHQKAAPKVPKLRQAGALQGNPSVLRETRFAPQEVVVPFGEQGVPALRDFVVIHSGASQPPLAKLYHHTAGQPLDGIAGPA